MNADLPVTDQTQQIAEQKEHEPHAEYAGFPGVVYKLNPVQNQQIDTAGNIQGGVIVPEVLSINLTSDPIVTCKS